MPWCEDCSKFWTPTSMNRDGSCPTCGRVIGEPAKVPWHFKLLVVATVAYLGFRAWQGLVLASDHGLLPWVIGGVAVMVIAVWGFVLRRSHRTSA